MHGLEDHYSGQMNFVYLDIDDNTTKRFKQQLEYVSQPHIFLLDASGSVLAQWIGPITMEEVEAAILDALSP